MEHDVEKIELRDAFMIPDRKAIWRCLPLLVTAGDWPGSRQACASDNQNPFSGAALG